ncbi:MAG: hypothetical protein KF722_09760 [Nitrospira sp.]|nr:hypothetical protein [Nitrospira sp.]
MRFRISLVLVLLVTAACGGETKHLPSSNPPEYDPKKVYSPPIEPSPRERATTQESLPVPEAPPPSAQSRPEPRSFSTATATGNPADLAKRILAGGPEGHRTLTAALTAAGFAILDSKRRTVVGIPAKPEMGLPLGDWEVEILTRAAADQVTAPFSEIEADLALALKDERARHLMTTILLDEIRAGVNDSSPTVRTWAGLIVELGRQSTSPYDLLTVKDFTSVHLTGLQQVLMLKHLAAEFIALGIQYATTSAISRQSPPSQAAERPLRLVSNTESQMWRVSSYQAGDPCGFGSDEGIATSKAASGWAAGLKWIFGPLRQLHDEISLMESYRKLSEETDLRSIYRRKELIEYRKGEDALLNKYVKNLSMAHNLATALLSLAELATVMNAVKIDISMDPAPPLERTKTRQPGHYAKLTAALSFDLGDLDLPTRSNVACTSWLFASVGLDFSMPENGPIKGADVEWTLVEGGLKMDSKAGYKITEGIVELENPGPRIQDAGVGFGDVKKSVRTNENGIAKVGIHGAPQKRDLGRDPQPVKKRATVRANVQLKPADVFRDLADALKGPWALPAQVLYRSHLLGKNYSFDVIDWSPPIRLLIQHRVQHDPQSSYAKIGYAQFDGTVQFEIPLEPVAEGWFRGELDVVRPMVVRHVKPAANPCSGSGSQTEHWWVSTRVDPTGKFMTMHVGFTSSNERASWTCRGPAGVFTSELYIDVSGILKSVQLPTMTGAKSEFLQRNRKLLEQLSVTVIEGIDE